MSNVIHLRKAVQLKMKETFSLQEYLNEFNSLTSIWIIHGRISIKSIARVNWVTIIVRGRLNEHASSGRN